MSTREKVQQLVSVINKELIELPKDINNLKTKGIHVFIYALTNINLDKQSSDTSYFRYTLIYKVNKLIKILGIIDYNFENEIEDNIFISLDQIGILYQLRLEYCTLNHILQQLLTVIKSDNYQDYNKYIEQFISIAESIYKYINENNILYVKQLTETLIYNSKDLKLTNNQIQKANEKLKEINTIKENLKCEDTLLIKLMNLMTNAIENENILYLLAYFKLFLDIIVIDESNINIINICKNIIDYYDRFTGQDFYYTVEHIIYNIIIEHNNSKI